MAPPTGPMTKSSPDVTASICIGTVTNRPQKHDDCEHPSLPLAAADAAERSVEPPECLTR